VYKLTKCCVHTYMLCAVLLKARAVSSVLGNCSLSLLKCVQCLFVV
jgi:hypothetical protein